MSENITPPAQQIALRIYGTKERRAGFASLVTAGVLFTPDEIKSLDRVPTISENPVYVIRNGADHQIFMIVDRQVKSFDADGPGVLTIAIAIPRGCVLAGNKSPYTLLNEVYATFRSQNMVPLAEGSFRFQNKPADETVYRQILASCMPLEAAPFPYVAMAETGPTGVLRVDSDEKMAQLFANDNYPEFRQFRDIEIGRSCAVSPALESLDIPRSVDYSVIVNGKPDPAVRLSRPDDSYTTRLTEDTSVYDYANVSFTLDEIVQAGEIKRDGADIRLDQAAAAIHVNVPVSKLHDTVALVVNGPDEARELIMQALKSGKMDLKIDYKSYGRALAEGRTVEVEALKGTHRVSINPTSVSGYKITEKHNLTVASAMRRLDVILTATATPTVPAVDNSRMGGASGGTSGGGTTGGGRQAAERLPEPPAGQQAKDYPAPAVNNSMLMLIGVGVLGLIVGAVVMWFLRPVLTPDQETPKIEELRQEKESLENKVDSLSNLLAAIPPVAEETQPAPVEAAVVPAVVPSPNDAEKAAAEEKRKAKAAEAAEAERKKAEARSSVLAMVNAGKKITDIRNAEEWKLLSKSERIAVESVLNLGQYAGQVKKEVRSLLKNKYQNTYPSWKQLQEAQKDIQAIVNNAASKE